MWMFCLMSSPAACWCTTCQCKCGGARIHFMSCAKEDSKFWWRTGIQTKGKRYSIVYTEGSQTLPIHGWRLDWIYMQQRWMLISVGYPPQTIVGLCFITKESEDLRSVLFFPVIFQIHDVMHILVKCKGFKIWGHCGFISDASLFVG